jgi:hypothetical protein
MEEGFNISFSANHAQKATAMQTRTAMHIPHRNAIRKSNSQTEVPTAMKIPIKSVFFYANLPLEILAAMNIPYTSAKCDLNPDRSTNLNASSEQPKKRNENTNSQSANRKKVPKKKLIYDVQRAPTGQYTLLCEFSISLPL